MVKIVINKNENIDNIYIFQNNELVEKYSENINSKRMEGNIYLGKIQDIIPGMQVAFVNIGQEKNGIIHVRDLVPKVSNVTGNEEIDVSKYDITKMIKPNDNIIVQVKRDSTDIKGPKLTRDIKLVGEYIILMPFTKIYTVSKKIEDTYEEKRLLNIVTNDEFGVIVRTSAENQDKEKIKQDISKLINIWRKILNNADKVEAPFELFNNNGIIGKIITDFLPYDPIIETNDEKIKKIIENDVGVSVKLAKNEIIDKTNKKIWLKCGGYITIDETEALVSIDVNSSKYSGKKNIDETFFEVNKEAAIEIARQIRLRDLGGIIIIDFIDMNNDEDREKIRKIFINETKKDRTKIQVMEFTKLGLLELTRKQIFKK